MEAASLKRQPDIKNEKKKALQMREKGREDFERQIKVRRKVKVIQAIKEKEATGGFLSKYFEQDYTL